MSYEQHGNYGDDDGAGGGADSLMIVSHLRCEQIPMTVIHKDAYSSEPWMSFREVRQLVSQITTLLHLIVPR